MAIISKNPATEEIMKSYEELSDKEIKSKLNLAQKAFEPWRSTSFSQRAELTLNLAKLFRQQKEKLAEITTKEMGRPITQSIASMEKCALACKYYAENAQKFMQANKVKTDASDSYISYESLGVILAVMPWNFPMWQVVRFLAPALMAGNIGLLKHASNVPQSALALEKIILEAGFPKGVFQTLLIGSKKVEAIINDKRIKAVTLTGSEFAGSQVAAQAARVIKKSVMELGGSDPFIILEDADVPYACEVGAKARFQNAGQSCLAAKRFVVVASRYDEFVKKYKEAVEGMSFGDPMKTKTMIGAVATEDILNEISKQVEDSVKMGAIIVTGGKRQNGKGYFYQPTILTNVKKGMPVYDEETFGPVAAVIKVKDTAEALTVANDTSFGLGASLWTADMKLAKTLIPKLEVGNVFVNGLVKSDVRLPFGGTKRSGFGRELSHFGMLEFVNIKTVWIK